MKRRKEEEEKREQEEKEDYKMKKILETSFNWAESWEKGEEMEFTPLVFWETDGLDYQYFKKL